LSNIGTWFIGKLQTERDRSKVLEGLEFAITSSGSKFNREVNEILSNLGNRIFLMYNVHDEEPVVFETRCTMSYLRGPLTKDQIKKLMENKREEFKISKTKEEKITQSIDIQGVEVSDKIPILPPEITQYFVPIKSHLEDGYSLVYKPSILGASLINYFNDKLGINLNIEKIFVTEINDSPIPVNWENSIELMIDLNELQNQPYQKCEFLPLPKAALNIKNYDVWKKEFLNYIYNNQKLELFKSPSFNQYSKPGESEQDFRIRLKQFANEKRDEELDKLRKKYGPKLKSIEEKLRKAEQIVERETEQAKQQKIQTTISIGATIIGAIIGKKLGGVTNIGRATTAARGGARVLKEEQDIERAKENVEKYKKELEELEKEFQSEIEKLSQKIDPLKEEFEKIIIKPMKKDIIIKLFSFVWLPYKKSSDGKLTPIF